MGTIVSTFIQYVLSHSYCFMLFFLVEVYCFFSHPKSEFSLFNIYQGSSNGQERSSKHSGTCVSSSISMTTKSIGKMNFPTLMSTSSRTPFGYAIILSTICKVIAVGVSPPKLSLFTTDNGIKLMLAPESHKAFLNSKFLMVKGMVKLPGSYIFFGKLLLITTLHVAIKFTTPSSENFLFLLKMSFRNLA